MKPLIPFLTSVVMLAPSGVGAQTIPERSAYEQFTRLGDMALEVEAPVGGEISAPPVGMFSQSETDCPSVWRHLAIGGGIGTVVGFLWGWRADSQQTPPGSSDDFWNFQSDYYYRITGSLIGTALGIGVGGITYGIRR